jgi:hypothetical protein
MRFFWPLLAFSLALPFCPVAHADSQALKLDDYRLKALIPAACTQMGGSIIYGTHSRDCKPPTITGKTPSSVTTAVRALPVTTKH